ncbi:MAG: M20/M25/M40 family metallo-hydrolase, partial [Actinobacteria bacterium]|nr:M20/M25/M40 family metallo-hydrolase [Actinomycetota bacterium]
MRGGGSRSRHVVHRSSTRCGDRRAEPRRRLEDTVHPDREEPPAVPTRPQRPVENPADRRATTPRTVEPLWTTGGVAWGYRGDLSTGTRRSSPDRVTQRRRAGHRPRAVGTAPPDPPRRAASGGTCAQRDTGPSGGPSRGGVARPGREPSCCLPARRGRRVRRGRHEAVGLEGACRLGLSGGRADCGPRTPDTALTGAPVADLPSGTTVPPDLADVADALVAGFDRTRAELESLVRIPSISASDAEACRRSAQHTAELLRAAGLGDVRLLEIEGAHPSVFGSWLGAGDDAPTVLLYAHHDVQPVGTVANWSSEPFTPEERDGRLYGRGAADDKAGILVHVAAVRAWLETRGALPVNVKVIIEGEEEIGSPHLGAFLDEHAETLRADVIVLTDLPNWKVGWPGLTYALRGMGELEVTLTALAQPVHSGMWGGPVPDALTAMVRLLATLHDDQGRIAVAGFADDVRPPTPEERRRLEELGEDREEFRDEVRMRKDVTFIGDPDATLWERVWRQPTITPVGIDAPSVAEASNTLLAQARAKLSTRFAPGQDPDRALAALRDHLEAHTPWGLSCEVTIGERNAAWTTEPGGPAWDAAT